MWWVLQKTYVLGKIFQNVVFQWHVDVNCANNPANLAFHYIQNLANVLWVSCLTGSGVFIYEHGGYTFELAPLFYGLLLNKSVELPQAHEVQVGILMLIRLGRES